ncbi:lipopolysaccharide biosynthesis protein [Botryobacter ruber]|uniref:lipopolysaccharide biosynthesis protein n=1 Tax=Botryobacter ruber TaxID=2171629 RepID=UPI0013E309B8|nr:oligosaccharide flippase family protein [Botryobacter ruber]
MQKAIDVFRLVRNKLFRSNFLRNLFIYSSGALFLKGISFFLIPLYTKVLAPAEYGFLELLNTLITVLSILFSFGLAQAVYVEYYHLNPAKRKEMVATVIGTYSLLGFPLFLLSGFALFYFDYLLFEQPVSFLIALLTIASSFLLFYQNLFFSILQISKKALNLTLNKLFLGLLTAGLNIYLVYYLRLGVTGILFSNCSLLLLSLVYPLFLFIKKIRPDFSNFTLGKSLHYIRTGLPFIISSLSYWVLSGVDRWLIGFILGERSVGLFSVAYKFSSVYEPLLIAPVLGVYTPYIFERFANNNFKQHKTRMTLAVSGLFVLLAFLSYILAKTFIDRSYYGSLVLIPFLVGSFAFYFLAQLISSPILFLKKSKALVVNIITSGLLNVLLNVIFLKHFGLIGAGMAALFSNFAWFLLSTAQSSYILRQKRQVS